MKHFFTSFLLIIFLINANAQNIGVNAKIPSGTMHIRGASSIAIPDLRITDTVDAFARIKLETTQAPNNFWDIAASGNDGFSKFNIFFRNKNAQFDLLSIDGETGIFSQKSFETTVGTYFYTGVNNYKGFSGFSTNNYSILAADPAGEIRFGTGGSTRNVMNAQGFLGINTLSPTAEIDVSTPDPDDGAKVSLSNSDKSHFLRFFSGKTTLSNPIIYWKHADALQLGLSDPDENNYQTFLTLDGKTIGIHNTGGSIFIGEGAGEQSTFVSSRPNLAIGRAALKNSVSRTQMFAIGDSTLVNNAVGATSSTHGNSNMAVGYKALKSNTLGHSNLAVGLHSMIKNVGGALNTAVGQYTLENNPDGSFNVVMGGSAMRFSESGGNNVVVGYQSLYYGNGFQNTVVGNTAMVLNTVGSQNTILGNNAMYNNIEGWSNVVIGYRAGYGSTGQSYTGNVLIGARTGENITASDRLYIDNSNTTSPLIYGEFNTNLVRINGNLQYTGSLTDVSDMRLKKKIIEVPDLISKLELIIPVTYEMNSDNNSKIEFNPGREYGVIAQELEKQFPLLVLTGKDGYKSVDYVKLSIVLLKGVQEQQQQINKQEKEMQLLSKDLEMMKEQLNILMKVRE